MTMVDDNLLATLPTRAARSGLRIGGNADHQQGKNEASAFENAFADVGKKKQPVIAIAGKSEAGKNTATPDADDGLEAASVQTIAKLRSGQAIKPGGSGEPAELPASTDRLAEPDQASDAARPLPNARAKRNSDALAQTAPDHGRLKDAAGSDEGESGMPTGRKPIVDVGGLNTRPVAKADRIILPSVARGVDQPEAGTSAEPLPLRSDKSVASDHKTKPGDARPDGADDPALSGESLSTASPAVVHQLLTMLDAVPTQNAAPALAQPTETPAMSEFQALADRAGKGRDIHLAKSETRPEQDGTAVKNATRAGTDQTFRFARADGKGQAVSMSLNSEGDKLAVKTEAFAGNGKAETVTVVEARRYLGLAPAGNAAAVTSQISANSEWAKAMRPSDPAIALNPVAEAAGSKVVNTLKIKMHPIDLGNVTATLRLKGDELHVELKVETGEAFRQLSDDQTAMVRALRAQGFAVDQVNVLFNAPDSSAGNGQQQPQAGPQGRDASGDGRQAQGRSQNNGNGSQGFERLERNDGTTDASSGLDLNSGGDVYI